MIHEAQKASLCFYQNKLIDYGFSEQESQFYHSFYLAIATGRVHDSSPLFGPFQMLSKAKHTIQRHIPTTSSSKGRQQNIPPGTAVHTSVLCRMRLNKQYRLQTTNPKWNGWMEWAVLRGQNNLIEECFTPQLTIIRCPVPGPQQSRMLL